MKTPINHPSFQAFIRPRKKRRNVVTVHLGSRVLLLTANEITYLQGDGNYTFVYTTNGKRYLVSKTMKTIDAVLNGGFLRIHKSHTINPDHLVSRLQSDHVLLSCGTKLPIARRRISEINQKLANNQTQF